MDSSRFLVDDEDESQIDLTPMLDVVFIMLIFFIVTSTFVKEAGVDVTRPEAETSVPTTHPAYKLVSQRTIRSILISGK